MCTIFKFNDYYLDNVVVMILGIVYIINIILHILLHTFCGGNKQVHDFTGSGQFYYATFSLPPTACRSILKTLELCTGFMWCIRCMVECTPIKGM